MIRDALRDMEERKTRLDALRAHLEQGARQAEYGDYSIEGVIAELDDNG